MNDCELAVVYCFDVSGSMNDELNGDTKLDRLKTAAKNSVTSFPVRDSDGMGLWRLGITTFPNNGSALLNMTSIDDENRSNVHSVIDSMSAGGATELSQALYLAGFLLASQTPDLPHVIVVFSDGWFGDLDLASNAATTLKNNGVFIITMGCGLDTVGEDALKQIASTKGDDTKAFFGANYTNLASIFVAETALLCKYLGISLEVQPSTYSIAPSGTASGIYNAKYLNGPPRDAVIEALGYPMAIESVNTGPYTFGPDEPPVGDKLRIRVPENALPGSSISQILRVRGLGSGLNGGIRASTTVRINVLDSAFDLEWHLIPKMSPRYIWDDIIGRSYRINATALLNHDLDITTEFSISINIRQLGEADTVDGWNVIVQSWTFEIQPADSPSQIPFALTAPISNQGMFEIELSVTAVESGITRCLKYELELPA